MIFVEVEDSGIVQILRFCGIDEDGSYVNRNLRSIAHGPRPTLSARGANPAQDHEEGTIQAETSESTGGAGAS
jgi:hypothetical protein